MLQPNDLVMILPYKNDPFNKVGRIIRMVINKDGEEMFWVSNLNMPFMGTVSEFFYENELEKVDYEV